MGYDERYDGQRSTEDKFVDELAAHHRLDEETVRRLLADARRAASEDEYSRPVEHWFEVLAHGHQPTPERLAPGRRTAIQAALDPWKRAPSPNVAPGRAMRTAGLSASLAGEPKPLDAAVARRMGDLFGTDFTGIKVVEASPEATGSIKAVVKDGEVHFRQGAYEPGTAAGDRLIAHELAHVVQQRTAAGPVGARTDIERDADRAASRVMAGLAAQVSMRAPVAAYAFNEGEDHDTSADVAGDDHGTHDAERDGDHGHESPSPAEAKSDDKAGENADAKKRGEEPGESEDEDGADPDAEHDQDHEVGGDPKAELHAIGTPVSAEDAGGGGGPAVGGGGAPPTPMKEPPAVGGGTPEAGLGQLRGSRPDKLGASLGQVQGAASTDVGKTRAKNAANPPKQMSTGGTVPKGKGAPPTAHGDHAAPKAAAPEAHDHADKAVKAEVPEAHAEKQAEQQSAAKEQQHAGSAIEQAAHAIGSWFSSWFGGAGDGPDKMSDDETHKQQNEVDSLQASASTISTDPGPAPQVEMKGEAKGSSDRDRAELEGKTAQLEGQGRADASTPMGEDHVETTVPTEELTASSVEGGDLPEAGLPTVAGAAPSEEVGIIAQEQHKPEIDAALTKASADMTVERGKHTQAEAQARTESDAQLRDLKTKADADTEAAKTSAQAEVTKARGEWKGEIDKKGKDARAKADKRISEGMAEVDREQTKANAEAKKHVEEGQQKADQEKQKGEKEAADAKEKGKHKSSGFVGWLKSKAKALVDGIKKAVSAAIDAAKKAVKAVIDAAKKLAMAAIDLARKAIKAAIQLIGKALLAITDVLLAAFPELKAKFQKFIKSAVDKACKLVDKLADGLKKAVQKALDLLGKAIDKALSLLEKGLHFIIDAAGKVINGIIDAAAAVAAALGTWVKLIKDVASGPGAWLRNLGAAVVDGIKNHLWGAFKTAVVEWFKSKIFELLGVGGIILQILLEGGINTDEITKMAMDALMVAIPIALVTILVEKLVSMIVPAAGAVMAVIEGLQAAWGTVSRIITAFGAFIAFLQAVKGGGAGGLFAGLLAAAAVVVLDFVANWLLKKLAGPARKVGAKLKGLADKFKKKFKGKFKRKPKAHAKRSKKKDHDHDHHDDHHKKDDHNDPKKKSAEEKKRDEDKKKQDRLDKAARELPPKISAAIAKRPRKLAFKARLLWWKTQYRLTSLRMVPSGNKFEIEAVVNPKAVLPGGVDAPHQLLDMLKRIAEELWDKHFRLRARPGATDTDKEQAATNRQRTQEDLDRMSEDAQKHSPQGTGPAFLPSRPSDDLRLAASQDKRPHDVIHGSSSEADGNSTQTRQQAGTGRFTKSVDPETGTTFGGHDYDELVSRFRAAGHEPEAIGLALRRLQTGGGIEPTFQNQAHELALLRTLLFNTEVQRDKRNMLFSAMGADLMNQGVDPKEILSRTHQEGKHPATLRGARVGFEDFDKKVWRDKQHGGPEGVRGIREENRRRQLALLEAWFHGQVDAGAAPVAPSIAELEQFVRDWVEHYYQMHPPSRTMKYNFDAALPEDFTLEKVKAVMDARGYEWAQRIPAAELQLAEEIWRLPEGRGIVRYVFDHFMDVPSIRAESDINGEPARIITDLGRDLPFLYIEPLLKAAKTSGGNRDYALRALAVITPFYNGGVATALRSALKDTDPKMRRLGLRTISRYPYYIFAKDLDGMAEAETDAELKADAVRLAKDLREHGRRGTLS